jgi:hypothetical protein
VFGREPETVMPWTVARCRLRTHVGRARSKRRAHRALAQELSAYATPADRDELAALLAGRGCTDCEAADILAAQARVEMLRDSGPPLWPFAGVVDSREPRPDAR